MDNVKQTEMWRSIARYGIYGFILALVAFLCALSFGQDLDFSTQEVIGYVTMIASLSFIFFGIKHYRDRVNDGKISFRRAVFMGLWIAGLTGIGIALADYIYLTLINPDFFEEYASVMRSEGYKGEIPNYGNGFLAMIMFLTVMMIGLVITLISALILQKK